LLLLKTRLGPFCFLVDPAVLKGHGFTACGKLDTEGGGGFNPRIRPIESMLALAPEGRFPQILPDNPSFSAASLAPEGMLASQTKAI
jgi:hypothetical protein